jgi:hypothetical protein
MTRRCFRFDRYHADFALVPGTNSADQPAAADRDQERVDLRQVGFQLHSERALAEHRLRLVVRVNRERSGLRDECLACSRGTSSSKHLKIGNAVFSLALI